MRGRVSASEKRNPWAVAGRQQKALAMAVVIDASADGEARFPAGNNSDLVTRDDAGAQREMARTHGERADLAEQRDAAGLTALIDDTAPAHSSDRDSRRWA